MSAAVSSSSNDSGSMTWHQWHAAYPTESSTGLSSSRARVKASSPHGYQSTGFEACWRRYGLVSSARRFTDSAYGLGLGADLEAEGLGAPRRGVGLGRRCVQRAREARGIAGARLVRRLLDVVHARVELLDR